MKTKRKIMFVAAIAILFPMFQSCLLGIGIMVANKRNETYWEHSDAVGEIEKKYTPLGSHDVSTKEYDAPGTDWGKYEVWFPSDIKDSSTAYPLVIMANGTGIKASEYKAVFKHLASWGFIVAGNEDENSRAGSSSAATLDFMLKLNSDKNSDFYGKIDTGKVGITGHSQGGVGAINAVTEQENGTYYKAVWAVSATSRYHAKNLGEGWSIELSKINIPCAMVAGTKYFDAGNIDKYTDSVSGKEAQGVCPLWWLEECYAAIPDSVDKVIARQKDKDHADILYSSDGYMTAWFMYYLKDDQAAGKAFFGDTPELSGNENWQDVKIHGGN